MDPTPAWATRIRKERAARNWSQAQAVANLRAVYHRAHGAEGGSQESLIRQWKDWEAGRVRPTFWAPYVSAAFGTVREDLFPQERATSSSLMASAEMDTAELVARLQRSDLDASTLQAIDLTVERLCTEYRYRATEDLRRDAHSWFKAVSRLLDARLTYAQHKEVLSKAGRLALLVGCVENDAGHPQAAEATRKFALNLGTEIDDRDIMGWAHEMSAWFALTAGDYNRVISASELGAQVAGNKGVAVQLWAQSAKAWSRLQNAQQVEVSLDKGRNILEKLPLPDNPDNHFVIDPAKWHFYVMDAYRNIGKDSIAQVYAEEVLRIGTTPDGQQRSPMRNAEARITLGVIALRSGDIDTAIDLGMKALDGPRHSLPSLAMVARELCFEFSTMQLDNDSRVVDFQHAVQSATVPLASLA